MWVGRATVFMVGLAVMLALVFGVAVTALAGTGVGATFNLGKINTVNALSRLEGSTLNSMLKIDQNGSGTALNLEVQDPANKPPMLVNSSTKVTNLNSDQLDGKSADQLLRVSYFAGFSNLANGTSGTVATTTINAPASGFLVIEGGSDVHNLLGDQSLRCEIQIDNAGLAAPGSARYIELNGAQDVNQDEDCSTNTVVPVSAGNHTVDLVARLFNAHPNTSFGSTTLSAIYIPFNGSGASPTSAAISGAQEGRTDIREAGSERP